MMSLTFGQAATIIGSLMLIAYAYKVVSYAAGDRINSLFTKMLSLVCHWQSKRMCSPEGEIQLEPIAFDEIEFLDPKTDPKWREFYVPTYMRRGRNLSLDQ